MNKTLPVGSKCPGCGIKQKYSDVTIHSSKNPCSWKGEPTPAPQGQHTILRMRNTPNENIELIDDQYNPVAKMVWYPNGLSEKTAREMVTAHNAHDGLIKGILELRDRLVMGQDASGNSEINQDEIELCNKLLTNGEL